MSRSPKNSLKRSLVWRLVRLQAIILAAAGLLIVGVLAWNGIVLSLESEDDAIEALRAALLHYESGGLKLRDTPELAKLWLHNPDLWFIVRDKEGHRLSEGTVPPEFVSIGEALDHIGQARLGWNLGDPRRTAARMKWVRARTGDVQIVVGAGGQVSLDRVLLTGVFFFLSEILPILVVMSLATFVATPIVVRHALNSLNQAAAQAERIDINQRGAQLPAGNLPSEVRPLVNAVNGALGRLDEGYERRERFLTDAAHELRTPIAILSTRLESLPRTTDSIRLIEDVARLSTLAEQLLDLQRLDRHCRKFARIDLAAISKCVAADLAPLAIAAGYRLSFEAEVKHAAIMGDQLSIERVLINLVQNAIEHGGRKGAITIFVRAAGVIEVADEGPGIPIAQRERIFEPFYRLEPHTRGAGLGLNLVREIVRLHKGHIAALDGLNGGACFRIRLPTVA